MHGNVWEWCRDAWDEKAYAKRGSRTLDPEVTNENDSARRVVRGGSWGGRARACRAACRGGDLPGDRWGSRGLRLAAGQEPAEPQKTERSDLPESARSSRKP
jgi:formylglycine-generating enzyme required for sulfatase activity